MSAESETVVLISGNGALLSSYTQLANKLKPLTCIFFSMKAAQKHS